MESRLLLDVVVGERTAILQLLAGKDQALLIRRNSLLVLNLGLDIVDRVRGLDLQSDGLSSKSLDENLHATTETKDKVKSALLLNVVVGKSATIFELLASKDQALLVWGNSLLILDLGLDIVDRVRRLDLQSDRLAREGLDKNLHTATQTKDKVKGRFLLDVIIRKGTAVLELLAGEDQTLLVWGDALLILDLGLDIVNGIRRLDLEGDRLSSQGLDKDLHSTTETEDEMERGFLLNVVVRESAPVLELLASEDQALLVWGDAFLVLDLGLDIIDRIRGFNLERDGLSSQSLDKDLHDEEAAIELLC
jgi:hypothetical protein